jgi:hypothetical protein
MSRLIRGAHSSVLMFQTTAASRGRASIRASNDPEIASSTGSKAGLLADGTVLDAFWTYDNSAATYLNIHARQSTDNGRTWSELWDTGVPRQPAPPVSLPDGSIAMVYVDRTCGSDHQSSHQCGSGQYLAGRYRADFA